MRLWWCTPHTARRKPAIARPGRGSMAKTSHRPRSRCRGRRSPNEMGAGRPHRPRKDGREGGPYAWVASHVRAKSSSGRLYVARARGVRRMSRFSLIANDAAYTSDMLEAGRAARTRSIRCRAARRLLQRIPQMRPRISLFETHSSAFAVKATVASSSTVIPSFSQTPWVPGDVKISTAAMTSFPRRNT